MKNTVIRALDQSIAASKKLSKSLDKLAKKRKSKPPAELAQQAALNAVMAGRKGGAHLAKPSRRDSRDAARIMF